MSCLVLHYCICYCVAALGSFVPQRKIRGVQSKIMHKDIIDSYQLKKRKELEQSLPSVEAVDVDMVNYHGYEINYVKGLMQN